MDPFIHEDDPVAHLRTKIKIFTVCRQNRMALGQIAASSFTCRRFGNVVCPVVGLFSSFTLNRMAVGSKQLYFLLEM